MAIIPYALPISSGSLEIDVILRIDRTGCAACCFKVI
jgi:hypothetical protein